MEHKLLLVFHTVLVAWLLVVVTATQHADNNEDVGIVETEFCDAEECTEKITESSIATRSSHHECSIGHHPRKKCTVHHVMLDKQTKSFKTYKSPDSEQLFTTWNIVNSDEPFKCDRNVKHGFVFLFYYHKGRSNYFHLHYDTLVPLYSQLRDHTAGGELNSDVLLMPSVETSRMKVIDWDTPAFTYEQDSSPIWIQMLSVFGSSSVFLPLSTAVWGSENAVWGSEEQKTVCFEQVHFGVPQVDYSDGDLIKDYVMFVRHQLGLAYLPLPSSPKIGIISRKNRRQIVNEDQLLSGQKHDSHGARRVFRHDIPPAGSIDWLGTGITCQGPEVELTNSFTVIAGINGAGLTNCLFLPTGAVAIQMVPYNATNLNYKAFGILLKSRGHYLELHSTDPDSSIKPPGGSFENADTVVDGNKFVVTLVEALTLGINKDLIAGGGI